jgi:malate dehydrogenase
MGTSAWYAPSAGTVQMAEAIIRDTKRIIPCAAYCENQFGIAPNAKGQGYFVGVPCVLGAGGMERVIDLPLEGAEKKLMDESISHVKELVGVVRKMFPDLA